MNILTASSSCLALMAACSGVADAQQLAGEPYIHDPSTITLSDGKYYTFGTGRGGLVSEDGWTWHAGASAPAAASRLMSSRSVSAITWPMPWVAAA
jgi:hypothetical protein